MSNDRMQYRINADIKKNAEYILEEQGIKPAQAITMFYTEVIKSGGFPFLPTKVPNEELAKSIREARKGIGVEKFENMDELFDSLDKL